MRYLVLTDLHANLEALESCLSDAGRRGYDQTLVLDNVLLTLLAASLQNDSQEPLGATGVPLTLRSPHRIRTVWAWMGLSDKSWPMTSPVTPC